jgi:hypothetical protein
MVNGVAFRFGGNHQVSNSKVGNHEVGDLLLKGRVGVLADSESD